ncbi:Crp/Fnr family transcriptional regulator [Roseateles cavernae]|uniref:Crp/Fnr family transcriptional regulator n=1 Tax=Roseateles cavernae TaxID=3153578 RepID=UPI0032E51BEB
MDLCNLVLVLEGVGITPAVAGQLAASASSRDFPKGALIEMRGQPARYWCKVECGAVAAQVKLGPDIEAPWPVTLVHGPGVWLGEAALVAGARRAVDIVALTDCRLILIPRELFMLALDGCPVFARYLLDTVGFRTARMTEVLLAVKHGSSAFRVACTLAHLAESLDSGGFDLAPASDPTVDLMASQQILAQVCNVSRVVLNGILATLNTAGFLRTCYGRTRLLRCADWRALAQRTRQAPLLPCTASISQVISALQGYTDLEAA